MRVFFSFLTGAIPLRKQSSHAALSAQSPSAALRTRCAVSLSQDESPGTARRQDECEIRDECKGQGSWGPAGFKLKLDATESCKPADGGRATCKNVWGHVVSSTDNKARAVEWKSTLLCITIMDRLSRLCRDNAPPLHPSYIATRYPDWKGHKTTTRLCSFAFLCGSAVSLCAALRLAFVILCLSLVVLHLIVVVLHLFGVVFCLLLSFCISLPSFYISLHLFVITFCCHSTSLSVTFFRWSLMGPPDHLGP